MADSKLYIQQIGYLISSLDVYVKCYGIKYTVVNSDNTTIINVYPSDKFDLDSVHQLAAAHGIHRAIALDSRFLYVSDLTTVEA